MSWSSIRNFAVAACALTVLSATAVEASTIDFTIKNGAADVATGSFSYSSGNPVITFADLTSFNLQIGPDSYDLTYVTNSPHNDNTFFQFVPGSGFQDGLGIFGLDVTLEAMSNSFDGFIFYNQGGINLWADNAQGAYGQSWTDIVFPNGVGGTPVPEPITISLFGAGIAGAAALRRRNKKSASQK